MAVSVTPRGVEHPNAASFTSASVRVAVSVTPRGVEHVTLCGYHASQVLRGRFSKSFEKPEPIQANMINEYKVGLHWRDHCFQKGHKIMVQVQSTWFPVIDRNPQKYVPNIFEAKDSDYQKATQRVYRTRKHPSYVSLPVFRQKASEDARER